MAKEKQIRQAPTFKRDPISIMVYVIIVLIVYFIVGILIKLVYTSMLLPPFRAMRVNVFDQNPLNFPARFVYSILYAQPLLSVLTTIFNYIMLFIILIYIIYKILQMIPLLGPALIAIIPPFRQFEEAGIFGLIDDIVTNIAKFLPKSVARMFRGIFIDVLQFTKDKIFDIVLLINPKLELDESTFNNFMREMKTKNMEGFVVQEKPKLEKPKNMFLVETEEAMKQKNLADKYRGVDSITPDMEMTDRMYATFNNELKKMQIQLGNTPNTIKMQLATLP